MTKPPKRTKADLTSERLYEISIAHFLEKGFDHATMRDLAAAAGLSPGAFYYHFPNKEAVIQVFYRKSFESFEREVRAILADPSPNFETRYVAVLKARLATFESHRELLIVLSRAAVDPRSPLSPFGPDQREIRDATIDLIRQTMETSDLKYDGDLKPYLPDLLWMLMMGTLFFWVFDTSPSQERTRTLIDTLVPQITKLIRFSRWPLTGGVLKPILACLQIAMPGRT